MIDPQQFHNLFVKIDSVLAKYRTVNELTGENFNVFKILRLESSEVRMHSAFIAELLNPKGSHGQKDIFLKLFIKAFCFKETDVDTESCRVEIEKHTGFISDDGTEGGRIDIFISDKDNHHIIIENKIYAGDRHNQLVRYYQYSENADLFYLTLEGNQPSENSHGKLKDEIHFRCISYKNHIIDWLEDCRKEMAILPIIRESITQYINLIKYLTNQTQNYFMQEELSEIIKNNLEASLSIAGNIDKTLDKISLEFGEKLERKFHNLELECHYDIDFKKRFNGIWITKPEWKYVSIGFQFQAYDKDMIYGLCSKKHPNYLISSELRAKLKALPYNTKKNNDWWPWFNGVDEPYKNWHNYNTWKTIIDGRMEQMILEKAQFLLKMTEGMSL